MGQQQGDQSDRRPGQERAPAPALPAEDRPSRRHRRTSGRRGAHPIPGDPDASSPKRRQKPPFTKTLATETGLSVEPGRTVEAHGLALDGASVAALEISPWKDLFVASAGASAALAFVAVSINIDRILKFRGLPERALETALLLSVVLVSIIGLNPRPEPHRARDRTARRSAAVRGRDRMLSKRSLPPRSSPQSWRLSRNTVTAAGTVPVSSAVRASWPSPGAVSTGPRRASSSRSPARWAMPGC